jgi:hypothetical protein
MSCQRDTVAYTILCYCICIVYMNVSTLTQARNFVVDWLTLLLCIRESQVQISAWRSAILRSFVAFLRLSGQIPG